MTMDLRALAELREKATPGPWEAGSNIVEGIDGEVWAGNERVADDTTSADADFIAAAGSFDYSAAADRTEALEAALREVVRLAEPDDDFDGQYIDFLVPANAIEAARAALESKP